MDEERLQRLPLFAGLGRRERRRLAQIAEEVDVDAGHVLARDGDLAYELFVIEQGTAEVSQGDETIASLAAGDFFGEIGVLADERRRTSTVVATSPMRLVVLQRSDVRTIEREQPEIAAQIRAAIDERVAADRRR